MGEGKLRMKSGHPFLFGAMVLIMAITYSCVTAGRSETQNVSATSKPPSINVLVDGQLARKTPIILKLERRNVHTYVKNFWRW